MTNNFDRKIIWSKWVDPLERGVSQDEYVPESEVKKFDNDDEGLYDLEEISPHGATPLAITSLGVVIPLKAFNDPSKVFNIWMGETNFNIGPKTAQIINRIPGVEILDVFTRYKFRIAIGNNFEFKRVTRNIQEALGVYNHIPKDYADHMVLDEQTKQSLKKLYDQKLSKLEQWAVYVLPNGKMHILTHDGDDLVFNDQLKIYQGSKSLVGGAIITNESQIT